jgi:hypothetical protein
MSPEASRPDGRQTAEQLKRLVGAVMPSLPARIFLGVAVSSGAMLRFTSLTPIWANTNFPTAYQTGCGAPQAWQFAGFNSVSPHKFEF